MKIYTVTHIFKEDDCIEQWKHCYRSLDDARNAIIKNVRKDWEELKLFWTGSHKAIASGDQIIEYDIHESELQGTVNENGNSGDVGHC